jgi:thioredoxin 1
MSQHITTLSEATFDEEIRAAGEPVLVDFWAEWCGPCKAVAPILDEIATEQDGALRVAKLNVDDSPAIAQRYGVMSIPTMIVFHDGQEAKRLVGAKGKGQLMQELSEFL